MRLAVLTATAVAAACAGPWCAAHAQAGNPAGMKPVADEAAPARPRAEETNTTDRLFVRLLAAGGTAEVRAGKLAGDRARNADVRAFGQRMAQDHSAAGDRLAEQARQAGVPALMEPTPDQQVAQRALENTPAERFDTEYLRAQLVEHQKAVQLLEWEIDQGQNAGLQHYASATLPTVMDHLQHLQGLLAPR